MKQTFAFSAVSVTALVLFASSLLVPATASAADRQIVVQPKFKSFKVIDQAATETTDVATTESNPKIQEFRVDDTQVAEVDRPKRPDRKNNKRFRVDDNQQAETEEFTPPSKPKVKQFRVDDEQLAETEQFTPPSKPKVKQFRVDDEQEQAADVNDDQAEDVAQLKPVFKPKAPRPQVEVLESTDDEDDDRSTLIDSAENNVDADEAPQVYVPKSHYKVRYPRQYVAYHTSRPVYRHTYSDNSNEVGSSCQNNVGY